MAKQKPESAAVQAFKSKWGNAKKPWPSEEAAALAAAEARNAPQDTPAKTKAARTKSRAKKKGKK